MINLDRIGRHNLQARDYNIRLTIRTSNLLALILIGVKLGRRRKSRCKCSIYVAWLQRENECDVNVEGGAHHSTTVN